MIKREIILSGVAILVGVLFLGVVYARLSNNPTGSVVGGNEYNSTVITSANASSTSTTFVKSGYGSLGSVIYSDASTTGSYPLLTLYNATSTSAATSTATTVFEMGDDNTTLGTYQIDAVFTDGLMYEVPANFDGTMTITWR